MATIDPLAALRKKGATMAAEGKGYNTLYKDATANQGLTPGAASNLANTTYTSGVPVKPTMTTQPGANPLGGLVSAAAPRENVNIPAAPTSPIIDRKPPTVATPTTPVVTKGGAVPTNEVIPLSRTKYDEIINKDPSKMSDSERGFLRRVQSGISEGKTLGAVFGEADNKAITPTMPEAPLSSADVEARRKQLAETTGGLVGAKRSALDAQLEQEKTRINDAGRKRMEAVNTSLSYSGFGRSTYGAQKQDEVMKDVQDQVAAAQAKSDLEAKIFEAQQQGADAKVIEGMQEQVDGYAQKIYESQLSAYNKTLELNTANKVKGNEAISNIFAVLSDESKNKIEKDGYDEKLSSRVGYAVDSFMKPLLDENGERVVFTGSKEAPGVVESYASELKNGRMNISSVPEGQRDAVIQRLAGMRREQGITTSSVNDFKAERIVKKGLGRAVDREKDAGYLSFVADRLEKGFSEGEILGELGASDAKSASFVAGNQKLFDDMQKDVKNFVDIERTYTGMKSIAEDALKKGDTKSLAASDQALVILFNKMLDPTSVVREGEFDRTAQGQAIMDRVQGYITRVNQGGVGIGPEARADMVRIAELLHAQAKNGFSLRKDQYGSIASDLGGDPSFVQRYFDNQVSQTKNEASLSDEESNQINEIFGSSGGAKEFKTGSGKTFKLNFSTPAQSGSTTGLKDLTSQRGNSIPYTGNVGKDLNNPGNLTAGGGADKHASGFVTVTGKDGVTRKFLTFASKDKGYEGVKEDLKAKMSGNSRYVKPTDTLGKLLDVWVGGKGAGASYKGTVSKRSGFSLDTPVTALDVDKILEGIKQAEGA